MNIFIKKCLIGTLLLISCFQLNAQRCTLPIAADCGIVTAQGGLADGSDYIFCDSSVVNFDNSSTGSPDSTYYCWGDGKDTAVAGTRLASHIYVLPANVACSKTFIIRMTVIKRCTFGTTKFTSSHYIETPIIVRRRPRGTFTGNTVGCTGVSLSLTNTSSCPPTSFRWLFGDGIIDSTNFNTGHIYTQAGVYNLRLVSNGCLGVSDTLKKTVTIYDPPISRATSASSSSANGCGPLTITFNNTSTNGSSYRWSVVTGPTGYAFVAPSTSTSFNPTMVFTDTGTYRVRLATTSAFCGSSNWDTLIRVQSAPLVSLASIPDACNTLTVRPSQLVTYSKGIPTSYNWTFTNTTPSSSTLRSPADITYPIGTYAITVAATNICGTSSSTINFKVTSPPTGGFTGLVNPPNNCIPADVQLQTNVLNVSSYNWQVISVGGFSYQGGTNSTSANPLLKLTSVGTYQIKMTAIGCSSITKDTTITLITAPSVILDSVANGCLPLTINPGAIVRYTNGTPVSYNWTFTGGSRPSDNVRNPSFVTYNDPGQYSILVGATNTCGTGRDTVTFRVDSLPEVSATLLPDKSIYCAPATITFNNDLKYVYQHQWKINGVGRYRFLSGTNVTSANPIIEFLDEGNYTIQLIGDGCVSDTWTRTIQVLAAPSVKLDSVPTNKCQTTTVNPTAIARFSGGTPSAYLWTFTGQNPDSSTIRNPTTLTYSPGNYSIIARAINACAMATDTVRFTVIPAPVVNAAAVFGNPNGCVPVDIDVQSRTQNAATYRWSVLNSTAFSFVNGTNLNSQNAVLRFTNQGSYQIRLNVQGCSAAQWDTTITLISAPSVKLDSVPNSCQALTVNPSAIAHFSGGTPTSYLWTFTGRNPDSSNIRNPSALTYTPGTYSIIARAINACAVATDTVRFLVAAAPVIGAAASFGNPNGCVPIDIDVQSNTQNAATYNWSVLNSTTFSFVNNTTANSQNAVLRFTDQGSYQIRLNVQGCRAAQWDTTITLITYPSVSLGNIPLNCAPYTVFPSSLVSYSGGTPTTYNWTFTGGTPTTSTLRAPTSVVFNTVGINKVIVNTSNVCGASTDTTDFILNGPPRATILTSVSDTNQCNPLELTINSSRSAFINTYRWTATGANFINNTSSSSANPVFRFSSAGSYSLHLDADGCGSTTWDTTITVIIPPSVFLAKILDTCGQMTVNPASIVQYNGGTPSKYTWIFTNTATPNSSLRLPPPITYNQAGQYSIIAKTENKCGVSSDTVKFSIKSKPIIQITPLPLLCNKDSAKQLQVTPLGGLWTGSGVTLNGLFNPTTAPLGINKLYYTYGNGQCLNADSLSIEVGGAIVQAGAPINVCQNETSVVLRGAAPANGIWTGMGIKDSINGVFDPRNLPLGTHTVTYTLKNSRTGCINQATKDITINAAPRAVFDTLSIGCVGTAVFFQNRSVGIDNVTWDFGDNTNTNLLSPSHIYDRTGQFPVWLRVNTVNGCKDSTSRLINVTKIGQPAFAPDRKEGCGPLLAISFNNTTQGQNLNYLWDFGTGQRYTTPNPPTILFKQSNYDTFYLAKLTVTNTCGAASVTDTIRVRPRPTANFGIRPRNDCSPMLVDFSNASLGYPTSFYWDFGNGRTSRDSALLPQTYLTDTAVRHYNVTLIVGNVCGSDTLTRPLTVLPPNAKAFFSIESTQGCAPFTARCINYSSVGSQVWWNSGNGVTSFSNTVFTPTYNTPGFYTITLYAANPNGCGFDSIQHRIEVLAPAEVGFVHPPSVCVGDTLTLRDTSRGFIFRIWQFGDNDSSRILNAIHVYKAAGTYTINMLGNTLNGNCAIIRNSQILVRPLPTANLLPDRTDGCPPLTVAFANRSTGNAYSAWNFGDGNSTNITTPTHRYDSSGNYTVKLRVTDNYGCSDDTLFSRIVVHDVPKARFAPQADKLCGLPVRVQFNNTSIGAVAYNWNLGNGLTSSTTNPTTSYGVQNTYPIQLIATNSFFCRDTFRTTYQTYNQPFADFSLTPQKGCEPLLVRFQDNSVNAVGKRRWFFGDGTTDTLLNPIHVYKLGSYTPKLIVSNGNVCFDSLELSKAVTVLENPVADFTARDSVALHPNGIIIFTNNSLSAQSYVWDFNDGSGKVTHVNPIHRYTKTGTYQVSLIAKAANGCLDTIAKPVKPQFFSGLFVPNAFSPESGADEIRKFTVQGLGMKTFKMAIYSSYGDLIWQTDKLADGKPVEGWDGTKNGASLPQDVYVWKIQATFEDGTVWLGMPDAKGRYYTTGTLTLLK